MKKISQTAVERSSVSYQNEMGSYFNPVISNQDRNFSRPLEPTQQNIQFNDDVIFDSNYAEDYEDAELKKIEKELLESNSTTTKPTTPAVPPTKPEPIDPKKEQEKLILSQKKFFAVHPFKEFPHYSGNVNSTEIDPAFSSTVKQIESMLAKEGYSGSLISGQTISALQFVKLYGAMSKYHLEKNKPKKTPDETVSENVGSGETAEIEGAKKIDTTWNNESIRQAQQMLSKSYPGVGVPYNGPIDGSNSKESLVALRDAATKIEKYISNAIGAPMSNTIYNHFNANQPIPKNPITTTENDIRSALELAQSYSSKK